MNLAGTVSVTGTTTISGGLVNVSGGNLYLPLLVISNGTLSNSVPVVINGPLNWSGGTIADVVQCDGGIVTGSVPAGGNLYLHGGELINTGTLIWTNATIADGAGSVISNAPGATINLAGKAPGTVDPDGTATFYNAGRINISPGSSVAAIADSFINTGTVAINSGTLNLQNGGTNEDNSTNTVAANATLEFYSSSGSTFTCTGGSYINGAGNLLFNGSGGGTVNLAGTVIITGTNTFSPNSIVNVTGDYTLISPLVISGGTLNVNGTGLLTPPVVIMSGGMLSNSVPVVINGPLNWSGGQISGVLQCNGGIVANSGGNLYLLGGELINNTGTLTWSNANIYDGADSVISNAPGATISLAGKSPSTFYIDTYGGTATLYNAGQFSVSVGLSVAAIADAFINTGTVTVNSGTLNLQNGGTNSSTINAGAAATLEISNPGTSPFTFTSSSALNGAGSLLFSGNGSAIIVNLAGAINVTGKATISAGLVNVTSDNFNLASLFISNGYLSNNVPVILSGPLNWSGGYILGTVQCNGGTLSYDDGAPMVLNGGELINTGTLAWNGTLYDGWGSVVSNAPGATINLTTNAVINDPGLSFATELMIGEGCRQPRSTTPASLMFQPGRMKSSLTTTLSTAAP